MGPGVSRSSSLRGVPDASDGSGRVDVLKVFSRGEVHTDREYSAWKGTGLTLAGIRAPVSRSPAPAVASVGGRTVEAYLPG